MSAPSRPIDVRGPRVAAWATSAVLAVALLTASGWPVAVQAAVVAAGALAGLRYAPYGPLVRTLVAPRLDAATGSCLGCELHPIVRPALPAHA